MVNVVAGSRVNPKSFSSWNNPAVWFPSTESNQPKRRDGNLNGLFLSLLLCCFLAHQIIKRKRKQKKKRHKFMVRHSSRSIRRPCACSYSTQHSGIKNKFSRALAAAAVPYIYTGVVNRLPFGWKRDLAIRSTVLRYSAYSFYAQTVIKSPQKTNKRWVEGAFFCTGGEPK